jgi:polyisoprenoid-binding protein YceI
MRLLMSLSKDDEATTPKRSCVMKWFFEPGHSAAEFRARHMMITWVRGSFKNVQGKLDFDPANPRRLAAQTS